MADTEEQQTNLIELTAHVHGKEYQAPVIRRLFFDRKSGGLSINPISAERGEGSDTEVAKHIAWEIQREKAHTENEQDQR